MYSTRNPVEGPELRPALEELELLGIGYGTLLGIFGHTFIFNTEDNGFVVVGTITGLSAKGKSEIVLTTSPIVVETGTVTCIKPGKGFLSELIVEVTEDKGGRLSGDWEDELVKNRWFGKLTII